SRTGVIDILQAMGGDIQLLDPREVSGEPVADILVRSSRLKGVAISGGVVPRAIDEFPAICIAAARAEGVTAIRDAKELRVKETDRITAMAGNLGKLGIMVSETEDGMDITGSERLLGGTVDSSGDHRIAMSMKDIACVATSFPSFFPLLEKVASR